MVTSVSDRSQTSNRLSDAFVELREFVDLTCARADGGFDFHVVEQEIRRLAAKIERAATARVLESLDCLGPEVEYQGRRYREHDQFSKIYKTLAGPAKVTRRLYREVGVRNGPTLDVVAVRAGMVEGTWSPAAARAMAFLLQLGTSREAEAAAKEMGCLPYGRSSFERVGHAMGRAHVANSEHVLEHVRKELEVPAQARSVAISIDRTSVPMEEIAEDGERVVRSFRMAYCASISLNDSDGRALAVLRYGRMPMTGTEHLTESIKEDLRHLLEERPDLRVVLLADGAKEMWRLMGEAVDGLVEPLERHHILDFWHLIEKLGHALEGLDDDNEVHDFTLEKWKLRLLNDEAAVMSIIEDLYPFGGTNGVDDAIIYMRQHRRRMNYAKARAFGLPIGSGNVEATCKTLMSQRLKRNGSRWKLETGQHIVQMRALALGDHWSVANRALFSALSKAKVARA